jgi:La domain-containing protein
VEYYFSDENLATDDHLFILCGGPKNEPVSLNQILGWKKMRQYKPRSKVIEALEKSTVIEVLQNERGKRMIRRRIPFVEEPVPEPIHDDPTAVFTLPSRTKTKEEDSRPEKDTESELPPGYARDEHGLVKLASQVL